MPGLRGGGVLPRRRRQVEDGEDESSTAGDLEDFSMSEGSAISNGDDEIDVEGSEVSADGGIAHPPSTNAKLVANVLKEQAEASKSPLGTAANTDAVRDSADLKKAGSYPAAEAPEDSPDFRASVSDITNGNQNATAQDASRPQRQEYASERAKREHQEYIRQRNANPAFVPNRGGFFLHDDRTSASSSPYGRPFTRGRGRGHNNGYGIGRGSSQTAPGPSDKQWAHDLHDTVNKAVVSPPVREVPVSTQIPTAKPAATAPNRTFSVSTVLGNVTVNVSLPGMSHKKVFQNIVKKQHTLLPQHRPPLRRDKPVRISIPDEDPRYIFPSTERSFIFIPRAMRPNQQIYTRGRGRGSFHGSRRPSIMGSTYTPSVAMSRKSSFGGAGSTGFHTPTEGSIPRGPMAQNFGRPIVRMPNMQSQMPAMQSAMMQPMSVAGGYMTPEPNVTGFPILHSPAVALPMHQPRPQKTVSVAEIESPAFKAPQQQQEQPFHQQMPSGVSLTEAAVPNQHGQSQGNLAINAPLSHIPEGAVYAQPFQPYPVYPQGGYYGPTFPSGPMMYPPTADPYNMAMGGPVMPPQYQGAAQNFVHVAQPRDVSNHVGAMAHESNGMVYYYDAGQFPADGSQVPQYPMGVSNGMAGVSAPGPFFYPAVPGGMFYAPTAQ